MQNDHSELKSAQPASEVSVLLPSFLTVVGLSLLAASHIPAPRLSELAIIGIFIAGCICLFIGGFQAAKSIYNDD